MVTAIAHGSNAKYVSVVSSPSSEDFVEIGNICYNFSVVLPIPQIKKIVEMTDKELQVLIDKSGTFDFWDEEEEDIYSISDGTPL